VTELLHYLFIFTCHIPSRSLLPATVYVLQLKTSECTDMQTDTANADPIGQKSI